MVLLPVHRHPRELALDLMFVVWVSYVLISGRIIPQEAIALFQHDSPAVVVIEPLESEPPVLPHQLDVDSFMPEA
jgi:hypothetical protein